MFSANKPSLLLCAALFASANAFFFNWGSSETPRIKEQYPSPGPYQAYYHQRLMQSRPYLYSPQQPLQQQQQQQQPPLAAPASLGPDSQQLPPSIAIPAIPIQVPLSAELAPVPNLHQVQLVNCLCPINAEGIVELDAVQQGSSSATSSVFVSQMGKPQPQVKRN